MTTTALWIVLAILAVAGIFICARLISTKRSADNKRTNCISRRVGIDCRGVLFGRFSSLFGIGIEKLGMGYYILLLVGYIALFIINIAGVGGDEAGALLHLIFYLLFLASITGLAFSAYLVFAQGVIIKKWCPWCLASALTSTLIFVVSTTALIISSTDIGLLFINHISLLLILQAIAISLGVASATISGIMTLRFLKDFRIDHSEDRRHSIISQLIWASILLLVLVDLTLYLVSPIAFLSSSTLVGQAFILSVLLVNNILLNLDIMPKLVGIRLDLGSIHARRALVLRQNAFASFAISIASWYSILFFGYFRSPNAPVGDDLVEVMSYYIATVIIVVIASQIFSLIFDRIKAKTIRRI